MSAITNTPTNKNFLSSLNLRFLIKRSPEISWFLQEATIPEIILPAVDTPSPFVRIPYGGDHITFEPLTITFKVDEDLKNYLAIHNWLKGLGKPENFQQYADINAKAPITGEGKYCDVSIEILSNNKMPNMTVTFMDAFPTQLTGLKFDVKQTDITYLEATATFRYTVYDIANSS